MKFYPKPILFPWLNRGGAGLLSVALLLALASGGLAQEPSAAAPPAATAAAGKDAAEAWKALSASPVNMRPPIEWAKKPPTPEAVAAWRKQTADLLRKKADEYRDFYTRFPKDSKELEARFQEWMNLGIVYQVDPTGLKERLAEIEKVLLSHPEVKAGERYEIRQAQVLRDANTPDALEKGARELLREFPDGNGYEILLMAGLRRPSDAHARELMEELVKSPAPDMVKQHAQMLLKQMERVGKPLDLRYEAVDGRPVDLAKLKGKVVLVDFWATWCGPCVAGLPEVKAAYDKLHGKGFEIVGVSCDMDKEKLLAFVKEREMPWPQYFDGKGLEGNKFALEYGVMGIPAMWLVDKTGVVRDINAREDLAGKAEKLLAE